MAEGDLGFKVAEINDIRLYIVTYPTAKGKGIIGAWQNPGIGTSTRTAEYLFGHIDSFKQVEWSGDLNELPPPTYLPENESHGKLRERISSLMHRAPIDPDRVKVTPDDVYLYVSGMAAIYHLNKALLKRQSGTILVLGAIFHNTWHLFEETSGGVKHFGDCSATSGVLDKVEEYLETERKNGRKISYAFTEFPSNPICVSVDLKRLRQLVSSTIKESRNPWYLTVIQADKYDFPIVADDTVGSFCNLDFMSVADMVMTSLTKSFSGYANVMGGSVVLNPDSPRYGEIKPHFTSDYRNEYFANDADVLLSNNADYIPRSIILNRNAATLAALLQKETDDPTSPVTGSLYPPHNDTFDNYKALMRRTTPEFTPGYGCLLNVDFEDLETAIAFYDNLAFYCGPHLGAHLSLANAFNTAVYGKVREEAKYHASYGLREEQVRLAVGLEDEEELVDTVNFALQKAREAKEAKKASGGSKAVEKENAEVVATTVEVSADAEG